MNHEMLKSLYYLLIISEVEEVEIFKVCLEYWSSFAAELYHETPLSGQMGLGSGSFRWRNLIFLTSKSNFYLGLFSDFLLMDRVHQWLLDRDVKPTKQFLPKLDT